MKMQTEPILTNTNPHFGVPPEEQNPLLQALGQPHVDSFNYMLEEGLAESIKDITPIHFPLPNKDKILLWVKDATIYQPRVPLGTIGVKNTKIFPTECRQRGATYKGKFLIQLGWSVNGKEQEPLEKDLGDIPIMIKSNRCHLNKLSPAELVAHKEHEQEWGGYFIINGHEKLIRMLVMTRRNYPIAIRRSTWKQRGSQFSDLGVLLRSVRDDNTASTNTLHYLTDGTAKFMFTYKMALYYIPVILILKCLLDVTDKYIYDALVLGCKDDLYYTSCIKNMLRTIHEEGLHTHRDCKKYVGKIFRVRLQHEVPPETKNSEICDFIIKRCIAIHLDDLNDKFHLIAYMTRKLYAVANEKNAVECHDGVMMQECLLGGHLYLQVLKEKLHTWLLVLRTVIMKRIKASGIAYRLTVQEMLTALGKTGSFESQMENFLATGNIKSQSGLGLMQNSGLSVVAENINRMRFMSHFRAIHRGSFFQTMRTTEARQLLGDAWGFICPIHTPDGAPCGLLNHLTMNCIVTKHPKPDMQASIIAEMVAVGMEQRLLEADWVNSYTVILDGKIIGLLEDKLVKKVVPWLRSLKIEGKKVPNTMEIAWVPKKRVPSQYPGLYLFTGPARMMRPVMNLSVGKVELIGSFEQVYMDICVVRSEAYPETTHQELSKPAFMSNLAQLIPMPDCNQSPRNMYQCQMGKQTMGTPCLNWQQQAGSKLYRLQTPGTPLFRPVHYDKINLDEFAMGTNAIVAVISYTGYDMEDAMIINKASYERGFAHGSIFKSEFVDLKDSKGYFQRDPRRPELVTNIDFDGLPFPGTRLSFDDPYYCLYDSDKGAYEVGKWKNKEDGYVDNVKICGNVSTSAPRRICITFRIPRNPSVGDKFASRAGQKGICSMLYSPEDLPFTASGLVPDIIFNPHGFPSRMTIAMMYEIMAGKSAAVHGLVHDATPFRFNEKERAVDYFGKLLELGGYDFYGTEKMYSGINGTEMEAAIFMGVVHYQRLRHMVADKWQVRSTGPIDVLTRQPIKGRRRGGGVRFGEMERDALISHGCSYLLRDRLFHCSDKMTTLACRKCGTLLGPGIEIISKTNKEYRRRCRLCDDDEFICEVDIPYIFKFLVTQFASCNINVKLEFDEI